jgi:hypothetical protein
MHRLLPILFISAIFIACSSDDPSSLKEWLGDQGIVASYGKHFEEVEIPVKSFVFGADSSAYFANSHLAFGSVNGIEQSFYLGLNNFDSLSAVWKFRTDSIFYREIYDSAYFGEKKIDAKIYWLKENEVEHDSAWIKFEKEFTDSADISFEWNKGATRDTFFVALPPELLDLGKTGDSIKLLAYIKPISNGQILRFAPPSITDVPGLWRVAQKPKILRECELCLHSGVGDSLFVSFEMKDKIKADQTIVFAQLVWPKQSDATGNELGRPLPVYVYSSLKLLLLEGIEDYRIDTAYVDEHGYHPNLVFWEGDSLRLQVTKSLRYYAGAANSMPDTLGFTLRFGTPMLIPKSYYFYNRISSTVFSNRPAYSSYDFSSALAGTAKLKIWYAKTDLD